MKRKQSNKLENIPAKKSAKIVVEDFNIDEYIDEHINNYIESFTKKCKKDFEILDNLTSGFLEYLETTDQTTPFEYSTMGNPFELSTVQNKAIDMFKSIVSNKGYKVSIMKSDSCSRYAHFSITVI